MSASDPSSRIAAGPRQILEHFLCPFRILRKKAEPRLHKSLSGETVHLLRDPFFQFCHHRGLHWFHIWEAEKLSCFRWRAVNFNSDLHDYSRRRIVRRYPLFGDSSMLLATSSQTAADGAAPVCCTPRKGRPRLPHSLHQPSTSSQTSRHSPRGAVGLRGVASHSFDLASSISGVTLSGSMRTIT
jgi:hypothetical protein